MASNEVDGLNEFEIVSFVVDLHRKNMFTYAAADYKLKIIVILMKTLLCKAVFVSYLLVCSRHLYMLFWDVLTVQIPFNYKTTMLVMYKFPFRGRRICIWNRPSLSGGKK